MSGGVPVTENESSNLGRRLYNIFFLFNTVVTECKKKKLLKISRKSNKIKNNASEQLGQPTGRFRVTRSRTPVLWLCRIQEELVYLSCH